MFAVEHVQSDGLGAGEEVHESNEGGVQKDNECSVEMCAAM